MTSSPPQPPKPLGVAPSGGTPWTLALQDEFTTPTLDRAKWVTAGSWQANDGGRSNIGNGELCYKTDGQNIAMSNGAQGQGIATFRSTRETASNGMAWTSGQISSIQQFRHACIEIKVQFPPLKGFLTSFWNWQAPGGTRHIETDVYEYYSDTQTRLWDMQTYVQGSNEGSVGSGPTAISPVPLAFNPTTAMHVYSANIKPGGTDFYVDGIKKFGNLYHPLDPWVVICYMTVNAISRAPIADAGTNEQLMLVDYIRVWT